MARFQWLFTKIYNWVLLWFYLLYIQYTYMHIIYIISVGNKKKKNVCVCNYHTHILAVWRDNIAKLSTLCVCAREMNDYGLPSHLILKQRRYSKVVRLWFLSLPGLLCKRCALLCGDPRGTFNTETIMPHSDFTTRSLSLSRSLQFIIPLTISTDFFVTDSIKDTHRLLSMPHGFLMSCYDRFDEPIS